MIIFPVVHDAKKFPKTEQTDDADKHGKKDPPSLEKE
jgi:hypothetical protein